jgi:hypothetical protein
MIYSLTPSVAHFDQKVLIESWMKLNQWTGDLGHALMLIHVQHGWASEVQVFHSQALSLSLFDSLFLILVLSRCDV